HEPLERVLGVRKHALDFDQIADHDLLLRRLPQTASPARQYTNLRAETARECSLGISDLQVVVSAFCFVYCECRQGETNAEEGIRAGREAADHRVSHDWFR